MAAGPILAGDAAEARRVLEADERWIAAFNRGDVETLAAIYAADVVVLPPDRADLHGREAVTDWMRAFFVEFTARQELVNDEVVAEGRWAFLRGHFVLRVTARASGRTETIRGKHLVVWRREPGGEWLAFRDLWSVESGVGTKEAN